VSIGSDDLAVAETKIFPQLATLRRQKQVPTNQGRRSRALSPGMDYKSRTNTAASLQTMQSKSQTLLGSGVDQGR